MRPNTDRQAMGWRSTGMLAAMLASLPVSGASARPVSITVYADELVTATGWLTNACETLNDVDPAERRTLAFRVSYLTAVATSTGATADASVQLEDLGVLPAATHRMLAAHLDLAAIAEEFSADVAPSPSLDSRFVSACHCALTTLRSITREVVGLAFPGTEYAPTGRKEDLPSCGLLIS